MGDTTHAWGLNLLDWFLITLPFILFVIEVLVGSIRQRAENQGAIADRVT